MNIDRVLNYSWESNHQLKLLVELIFWHGIKSQRDKKVTGSNLIHPSFLSGIFSVKYEGGLTLSPMGSCMRGRDRVLNYSWDSNHQLKLFVELVLCQTCWLCCFFFLDINKNSNEKHHFKRQNLKLQSILYNLTTNK